MNAIIRRFDRAPLEDRLLRANPAQPPRPKSQGQGPGRPMGPPGSGYGGSGHVPSGHGSVSSHASTSHGAPTRQYSSGNGPASGQSSASGQGAASANPSASAHGAASGQASGANPSATADGENRPPRRRKGSAKRPSSGGPQTPFAEELAKAL
jgi:hypothetical protein